MRGRRAKCRPRTHAICCNTLARQAGSSRADVVRMLDKICEYYKREEPSSPVPYILKRAQRLAEMDFMAIIDDLSPDSVKEIQRITGEKPKE